jgi:hypothetical protein
MSNRACTSRSAGYTDYPSRALPSRDNGSDDLRPQNGRGVLVKLRDGRQLEAAFHSMTGR